MSEIGDFCFSECLTLKSISIPTSVNKIGYGCFYHCESLKSISIPRVFKSGIKNFFESYSDGGKKPRGCKITYI